MGLYSLLLGLGLAVSAPWWVGRMLLASRYRQGLPERLGRVPARVREAVRGRRVVWVHAVSVGEVLAVAALVNALGEALGQEATGDGWCVVVSTTTRTGQALARERFGAERVFLFPLDFAWAVRAWLRVLRPRLVVLVESELWPRLLAECARRGVPVAVVNARLSDRSFRRARRVRRLWARVLRRVTLFLAQSEETAERLRTLGVPSASVRVYGNLKYDAEPRETPTVRRLRPLLARRCVVVGGSLLSGEERLLLGAWQTLAPALRDGVLVLAPRHPERFDEVAKLLRGQFAYVRVSSLPHGADAGSGPAQLAPGTVVLLDTVGDLAALYGLAEVAFVGGSLVPKGGHNPLEPARCGVPVVMGPSFENFREIVTEMQTGGAIEIVRDGNELASTLRRLLKDRVGADELGQRGYGVFRRKQGATERSVAALITLLEEQGPPHAGRGAWP